jgi:hypothetical protein
MKNPFISDGLQILDGSECGYSPTVPVVFNSEGELVITLPAGWSEAACWSAIRKLSDAWNAGFKAGQADIQSKIRKDLGLEPPAQN